jgi:hypothetical protein
MKEVIVFLLFDNPGEKTPRRPGNSPTTNKWRQSSKAYYRSPFTDQLIP